MTKRADMACLTTKCKHTATKTTQHRGKVIEECLEPTCRATRIWRTAVGRWSKGSGLRLVGQPSPATEPPSRAE